MKKLYLQLLFSTVLAGSSAAQIAQPDTTFGNNGAVIADVNNHNDAATDMLQQPDGKFVVTGTAILQSYKQFMVMRFNANGTADSSFGTNGQSVITVSAFNNYAKAIVQQQDGKLLVAGYYDNNWYNDPVVVRLNTDGSPDSAFGVNGMSKLVLTSSYDEFHDIAIQPDGKIIVAGRTYINNNYDFLIMRLNTDGSVDSSFSGDGWVNADFSGGDDCIYSLLIMPDGKFLVSGNTEPGSSYFAAARFHADGSADASFGNGGKVIIGSGNRFDKCNGMAVQADSSIVLAGKYHNGPVDNYMIVRLTHEGQQDVSFGTNGVQLLPTTNADDILHDVIIQPDGMILLAGKGDGHKAMMMRLTTAGTPDPSFGINGIYSGNLGGIRSELTSLLLLADYSVIACGFTNQGVHEDFLLVKALSGTSTNITDHKANSITNIYPNPAASHLSVKTDDPAAVDEINIYDGSGRKITGFATQLSGYVIDISLPVLSPGIYLLQVISGKNHSSKNFIIQ